MIIMGNLFATYKTYILAGAGVLVALVAWWSLSGDDGSSGAVLATQGDTALASNERDIVDTLLQLRAVSLSGTVFSDPVFSSLQDFGTQIVPEPVGRPNPFAPVSSNAESATGTSAQLFPQQP